MLTETIRFDVPEGRPLAETASAVAEGRFDPGTTDWVYVPVEVPTGVAELTVSYAYERPDPPAGRHGNAMDLGVFGPGGGFRGYSGGARDRFTIGPAEVTTPGYVAGPVEAGTWRVLLAPYTIAPDGLAYRLEVTIRPGPPGAAAEPVYPPVRAAGRGAAWYRGDLHLHTEHSDGRWTPERLAGAARAAGLDFVATTEHNTPTAHGVWGRYAGDDLLVICGEEVTTRNGHLVAVGLTPGAWLDWRFRAVDGTPEQAAISLACKEIRGHGGLAIAAHPHAPCLGCQWKFGYADVDAVEVWNGPWTIDDEVALQDWNATLVASPTWLPAVGNSDSHTPDDRPGLAQTVVYAEDLTREAILAGVRAGRSYLAESSSVVVAFEARTGGCPGRTAGIGERLDVPRDTLVTLHVEVSGVEQGYVRFVTDEGWAAQIPLPTTDSSTARIVEWQTTPAVSSYVRVEVRRSDEGATPFLEPMAALTNPIFLGGTTR